MYYFSMAVAILATAAYNICQKSINGTVNPAVSMVVTYLTALLASVAAMLLLPGAQGIAGSFRQLNWASYVLGIAIFALEIGYLYVYRSGWSIAIAPLFATIVTTVLLAGIGVLIYRDKISLVNGLGICLSIVGLILMNKK